MALKNKVWFRKLKTVVLILLILCVYLAINYFVQFKIDLPVIDVTEQKVYTLTDISKKAIENIDKEVNIYLYGYSEKHAVTNLVKQYCRHNNNIKYQIATEETNPSLIKEYELEEGYEVVIIESEGKKTLKSGNEFTTTDFNTYEELDLTEQEITNGILNVTLTNNPKVYFMTGHGEITLDKMYVLKTYLELEANEVSEVNLLSAEKVPEDCSVLVIASPQKDISTTERDKILEYLNNGGNLFVTTGLLPVNIGFTNLQTVLDFFGVKYNYGYIAETSSDRAHEKSKIITFPILNEDHEITADIASEKLSLVLPTAGKITLVDDATLTSLNTTVTTLLYSSKTATFTEDASSKVDVAIQSGVQGEYIEGVVAKRTVQQNSNNLFDETGNVISQMVYIANDLFMTDYIISEISTNYPLSYLDGNRDLALNSISYLNGRNDTISVRKSVGTATFSTTEYQSTQVLILIFALPVIIIISGSSVFRYRKRRV